MKKVVIIGSGGSGKSTLARNIGRITGIEIVHLDKLFWQPGWVSIPREELADKVKDIVQGESWIIDGNYSGTMDIRMEVADTLVYLDFPTIACLLGIFKRWMMYAGKKRPDMTEGCNEKIDLDFFNWVLTFRRRNRKKILAWLDQYAEGRRVVILKNRRQVNHFVYELENET